MFFILIFCGQWFVTTATLGCHGSQQVDLISKTQSNRYGCPAVAAHLCAGRGKPISRLRSWKQTLPTKKVGSKQGLGGWEHAGLPKAKIRSFRENVIFANSISRN